MLKYLVIIAVIVVIAFAIAARQSGPQYEKTNITFQGYNPDTHGDCKDTCLASCQHYGLLYDGYRYELNNKNCICFCLKKV